MILSRKFLSDYIKIDEDITIEELAEDMTRVGNEYDYAGKLINATNLVIGEVVECEMHLESDHLHVTKVNVGDEVLSIVCGAPNMRKGLKVIVAKNGAELPGGTIKKSVIRGQESNGMCCSIAELGLDKKFLHEKDIEGIHELPEDAPVGENPLKYLELDDEIINFELTSNRSDLLSMIGLAYEVGAIYDKKVTEPKAEYNTIHENTDLTVDILTDKVSVFLMGKVNDVKITESPLFMKNRLIASDIRPINNVVDISNYVMLETGQPLHFYDADKVGAYLGVRDAKDNEELTTLDNVKRVLNSNDIVIINKEEAIGLAGVMGGLDTEVTESTKNILIEAAIFDAGTIRKTAKKILRSEASSRFEKGIDAKRTYLAMERSKELLEKYADAKVTDYNFVYDNSNKEDKKVVITLSKINSVLGMELTIEDVKETLRKLAFNIEVNGENLTVYVPSRRLDVNISEDIIEEVGRIYGVDNIEPTIPSSNKKGSIDKYNRDIKVRLSSMGLNEAITYTLISEDKCNMLNSDGSVIKVLEPLVSDKNVLRTNVITSLMDTYSYNKARGNKDINIFEIGEVFYNKDNEYTQEEVLSILMSGEYISGINTKENADFYYLKGIVENLLVYLGYAGRFDFNRLEDNKLLHPGVSASVIVSGQVVGFIGELHPSIMKDKVYVCEINLTKLKSYKTGKIKFREVSKFPGIKKDISFIIDKDVMARDIIKDIKTSSTKILKDAYAYDEYINGSERSVTFTLVFSDDEKTLTDEEVTPVFNKVIDTISNKYNAKLKNM